MKIYPLIGFLLFSFGCIRPKLYRTEKNARLLAEEREKVLLKELADRKIESAFLVQQVGLLNKIIGSQELKITDMSREISGLTKSQTESSAQLRAEKTALERELSNKNEILMRRESLLQTIRHEMARRADSLNRMHAALTRLYEGQPMDTVTVVIERDELHILYSDKTLFKGESASIPASARQILGPLASFLSLRPELDVDVLSYTDNVLPAKNKAFKDTWEWSLARAIQVVRTLIRDYNVNANQLTPVGKGEFYPLTSNDTPEGRETNRRTVVVIRSFPPLLPPVE
jgi:chemotaxis protein MotB